MSQNAFPMTVIIRRISDTRVGALAAIVLFSILYQSGFDAFPYDLMQF
jgi:hypothetical protein